MALELTNAEMINVSPLLLADIVGKADSGSTTTVVSRALSHLTEEEVVGAYICFLSNGNKGLDRIITDYTSTGGHGTFTFDALPHAIDEASIFAIMYLSYVPASDRALEIVTNDLRKKGYDIDLFLEDTQLKELFLNKAISHICQCKMQDATDQDTYYVNYQIFEERYKTELNTLVADYDESEDGTISIDEQGINVGQVRLTK